MAITPLAGIEAISNVYFPEFESQLKAFIEVSSNYELWILNTSKSVKEAGRVVAKELLDACAPYVMHLLASFETLRATPDVSFNRE